MPITIQGQKAIANEVLDSIKLIDPSCILAGGAPRDWYLGTPAHDLDFYYHISPHIGTKDAASQLATLLHVPVHILGGDMDKSVYQGMNHLMHVFECTFMGITCQFMRMDCPTFQHTVDDFACSLSKVWYKDKHIRREFEFDACLKLKVVVYAETVDEENRYYKKIAARFPEYTHILRYNAPEPEEESCEFS